MLIFILSVAIKPKYKKDEYRSGVEPNWNSLLRFEWFKIVFSLTVWAIKVKFITAGFASENI